MPASFHNSRWDHYHCDPRQSPLDALNNWEGRAKARVDWDITQRREPDNTVIHTAIPIVSCDQYHDVRDDIMSHLRRVCKGPHDSSRVVQEALIAWLGPQGQTLVRFGFDGCYDRHGQYVAWATNYECRLEYLHIQSCKGQGRSAKDAKHQAALMLLNSYHCMIRLSR